MLDAGARILTLWGPAGVGKTRLARACAGSSSGFVASWFVDLSPSSTWSEAATEVAAWSDAAPEATFLITSREALALGDEVVYEVSPLGLVAAAELFSARAVAAGGSVEPGDAAAITQIVSQLDCLPLAVELAASQLPFMSCAELVTRLATLDLFDSGRRDVRQRQRTLRGTLEWSWRLLPLVEQQVLAESAVFRGGFSLAAAEATLLGGAASSLVITTLRSLHRRSLLVSRTLDGGEVRYALLFEVRSYAAEQLAERASADPAQVAALRDRHARYYAGAAAAWASQAVGPDGAEMRNRLAGERDNLLDAHAHALGRDPVGAAGIALALEPLLVARGPVSLLRQLLTAVLDAGGGVDGMPAGEVHFARAVAARRMGDSAAALADFDRAQEVARGKGDRILEGRVLSERGRWLAEQTQCELAMEPLAAALGLAVSTGDRALEAEVLSNFGHALWYDGKLTAASEHYARALPLARASALPGLEARITASLGAICNDRGDLVTYLANTQAAQALARRAGEYRYAAFLTMYLALAASEQHRIADAERYFEECLKDLREIGDVVGEGHCLINLGWEELRHGRSLARVYFERALALLRGAGIAWADGFIRATLAAIAAIEDRIEDARALIEQAKLDLVSIRDPYTHDVAHLYYAHLDLALARRAEAQGDLPRAEELRDAVRALLANRPTGPDAGRSDERVARALLERGLAGPLRVPTITAPRPSWTDDALLVGVDACGFRPPSGGWVDLSRRKVLRRVLMALLPGQQLTIDELLGAGWPGERVAAQAGAARVHVAISTLRRMGLAEILLRSEVGYHLDPRVQIVCDVTPWSAGQR